MLGNINLDMLSPEAPDTSTLIDLFNIYGLSQLIEEPMRVTSSSRTPIDLCVTNSPQKIVNAASRILELVITLWHISFGKTLPATTPRIIQSPVFKNSNKNEFFQDLNVKPWHEISSQINPNCMWDIWKVLIIECIHKHAPT